MPHISTVAIRVRLMRSLNSIANMNESVLANMRSIMISVTPMSRAVHTLARSPKVVWRMMPE